MKIERLQEILDAYGADPSRWPAGERAAAEGLLRGSTEARAMQTQAATLDTALDHWQAPPTDPWLVQRIVAKARSTPQRRPSLFERLGIFLPGPVWPQLAGLAGALLIGFVIGMSDIVQADAADTIDMTSLVLGYTPWENML